MILRLKIIIERERKGRRQREREKKKITGKEMMIIFFHNECVIHQYTVRLKTTVKGEYFGFENFAMAYIVQAS